jgi:YidC/Oxa1 family membrane protein insertase
VLEFIYYPVSFILWCWHWVFGHVFGEASGIAWALGIMFLVFTLRAIMFKPFVKQVRSMRQMQQFAPEIKKLQAKYKNDKQKLAVEMQKLQRENGFSPLGGCLPMLLQIPVFIGLFHVLRSFGPGKNENYFFDAAGNASYMAAKLFGAGLSSFITQPEAQIAAYSTGRTAVILVSLPLMILASILTHLTARHSVTRQNPESATAQTAIMNKVTLYLFPMGVLIFGFFFPIGLLLYWLANNSWTLMQQNIVYRKIDREEEEKKTAAIEKRNALGPKPGQKPTQTKKRAAAAKPADANDSTDSSNSTDSTDSTPSAEPPKPAAQKPAGTVRRRRPSTGRPTNAKSANSSNSDSAKASESSGAQGNGSPAKKPAAPKRPAANSKPANPGSTEIPGLISDRSRSKKSGRKNR